MSTRSDNLRENRRIILLRLLDGKDPEVLLNFERTPYDLPQVPVVRSERIAEQLTAGIKEICNIDAVSISALEVRFTRPCGEQLAYEIMEPQKKAAEEAPTGKYWVSCNSLVESGFDDRNDFHAVRQAITQAITSAEGASFGQFAHLGWFRKLEQWVQDEIRPHGLRLTGKFRQLNASPTFSLIRFETDGPAVWFKSVGAPNEREYALTLALESEFPRFLPRIIAKRPQCNGWLSMEAEGPLLDGASGSASWGLVAQDLAELQIHSLDGCDCLLNLGAHDLRVPALTNLVEPFLEIVEELMERQPKTPPPRLSREQLRELSARLYDALRLLGETGIPETLGHMDINPRNIVCSSRGSVFLDWAEAFVGHPFLTFEYLLAHSRRTLGESSSHQALLVDRYLSRWRKLIPERDILEDHDVTPLIAVFAYAVGNGAWRDLRKIHEPRASAYLRSLARRIEWEAALLERRVSCLG